MLFRISLKIKDTILEREIKFIWRVRNDFEKWFFLATNSLIGTDYINVVIDANIGIIFDE